MNPMNPINPMNPMNPMNSYPVKYSLAPAYETEEVKPTKKYTNMFLIISIVYLILIFLFTLIIYSSLYGHQELYNKHHRTLRTQIKGTFTQADSYSSGKCPLHEVKKIEDIQSYHKHQHPADFVFCYIILGLCIFTFLLWILVFISRGKVGGLNSKGAIAFVVFLFFLIIVATITYFIYFMCEGEDNIDGFRRIDGNFGSLLNTKCYTLSPVEGVSIDYIQGYINTVLDIIRPFVIVNFIVSCIYLLIWMGLLGAASSKKSLCLPQ